MLDRDRAAVAALRAQLTARRDAAAATLAFEFAGRLQAELEALDWVTGEQKVTGAQDDADVCGWADGVLVWFEIRDAARLGRFRPPQCRIGDALALAACRIGGAAQASCSMNLCWQKLNQLPESSRSSASMP